MDGAKRNEQPFVDLVTFARLCLTSTSTRPSLFHTMDAGQEWGLLEC